MKKPLIRVFKINPPLSLIRILANSESKLIGSYKVNECLMVIISHDGDLDELHISITHNDRYPTWDEIRNIKYYFYPDVPMIMHFPADPNYVNIHENCFHLYQHNVA
ncbi:MAG: DUF7694 domain-containing protein [Lutibacter sp.]